jgi:hypothetical protein
MRLRVRNVYLLCPCRIKVLDKLRNLLLVSLKENVGGVLQPFASFPFVVFRKRFIAVFIGNLPMRSFSSSWAPGLPFGAAACSSLHPKLKSTVNATANTHRLLR